MFTGIIESTGKIISFQNRKVTILIPAYQKINIGESISVNGMCLTVESVKDENYTFYLSYESLKRSSLELWKKGNIVNIERAITPEKLMGGHIITGHIDCIGIVKDFYKREILKIEYPKKFSKYLVEKGSISINGVSLTVSKISRESFEVSIIPHTLKNTNIINLKIGDKVHLEFDIIAKYLEKSIDKKDKYENFQ